MERRVADVMWEMLAQAGVKRCYGIVGDALNPVLDALRRNGEIEFIHVRHEEYGVFAAVAESYLSGNPVVVCGTAGAGTAHLFNGLMDARTGGFSDRFHGARWPTPLPTHSARNSHFPAARRLLCVATEGSRCSASAIC